MKLVLFNGPPSSGKDTAADIICGNLHPDTGRYALATPLYRAVKELFQIDDSDWYQMLKHKDMAQVVFGLHSLRETLISLSQRWLKPQFGEQALVKSAIRHLAHGTFYESVCITDLGFDVEVTHLATAFQPKNVLLVFMSRLGHTFEYDSRRYVVVPMGVKTVSISNDFDMLMFTEQLKRDVLPFLEE